MRISAALQSQTSLGSKPAIRRYLLGKLCALLITQKNAFSVPRNLIHTNFLSYHGFYGLKGIKIRKRCEIIVKYFRNNKYFYLQEKRLSMYAQKHIKID